MVWSIGYHNGSRKDSDGPNNHMKKNRKKNLVRDY